MGGPRPFAPPLPFYPLRPPGSDPLSLSLSLLMWRPICLTLNPFLDPFECPPVSLPTPLFSCVSSPLHIQMPICLPLCTSLLCFSVSPPFSVFFSPSLVRSLSIPPSLPPSLPPCLSLFLSLSTHTHTHKISLSTHAINTPRSLSLSVFHSILPFFSPFLPVSSRVSKLSLALALVLSLSRFLCAHTRAQGTTRSGDFVFVSRRIRRDQGFPGKPFTCQGRARQPMPWIATSSSAMSKPPS